MKRELADENSLGIPLAATPIGNRASGEEKMMNVERGLMALDCTSPNQINSGFATEGNLLTMADGKFRRWLKEALQNPLTFVCLVWAAMFLMTVLFLKLID